MRTSQARLTKQRGSMLIEGLIAILIFSVGILALVGMQATAINTTTAAKYRADASYLANQIISQMWADRANIASYPHHPTTGASACVPSGTASANANLANWLTDVQNALPGAGANVQQVVVGANNLVTVTVCWQGPQDSAPHNFIATAQVNG
jgi:type IV pilus assembly protein PilV